MGHFEIIKLQKIRPNGKWLSLLPWYEQAQVQVMSGFLAI